MIAPATVHEAVSSMSASKRYKYMVSQAARLGEVWGLWGPDSWVWFKDGKGRELYPVWPKRECVLDWGVDTTAGFVPRRMDLDYCLERWVTAVMNSDRMVAVFPVSGDHGMVISAGRLFYDIKTESEYYEYGWEG